MILQENISLFPYNTFGIDVRCRYFAEYGSVAESQELVKSDIFRSNRVLHIGSGSNLLFMNDFDGLILHSKIRGVELIDETSSNVYLRVGAGKVWDDFVAFAVSKNYYGIENLSNIPGKAGASVVQNIGAYGVEVKDVVSSVETVEIKTGKVKIFSKEECKFSYRNSIFKNEKNGQYIVTHVVYCLSKQPNYSLNYGNLSDLLKEESEINLAVIRSAIISVRNEKLPNPKELGNAGSFFMNPVVAKEHYLNLRLNYPTIPGYELPSNQIKIPAAWLIEQCGWKGKSLGRVAVYEKQALVLVNKGQATGQEIMYLASEIAYSVKEKFNIELFPEVIII